MRRILRFFWLLIKPTATIVGGIISGLMILALLFGAAFLASPFYALFYTVALIIFCILCVGGFAALLYYLIKFLINFVKTSWENSK